MELPRLLALGAVTIALQGCAFTNATLDVAANEDVRIAGPLGDVPSIRFSTPEIHDARADQARIGWKQNGHGTNTADIRTERPVELILGNAVAKALADAHHHVGENGAVRVVGTVDRFWFDIDANFWTIAFKGDIQCTLEFIDAGSQQSIYRSKYSGSHSESKPGGYTGTWATVMSKALDKLIEDIVLDDELAEALRRSSDSS